VTYGPGEIYWQRFGHNGIWVRDADLGLDHVFNFGFFDFAQERFFLRFLQGRMLYFSAAQPAQQEFAQYIDGNRSIRAQRLDIDSDQALRLIDYLVNQTRPQNRDYLYDYFTNNCSTRVRDALDRVFDGRLQSWFATQPASQTWRDHTRRSTVPDYWLYLGLELVLGAPTDGRISRWDEFFIPDQLADAMAVLQLGDGVESKPVVVEDVMLFESSLPPPPAVPGHWWPAYLVLSLGLLLAGFVLGRWVEGRRLAQIWFVLAGLVGSALLMLWLFTDHAVAANNFNLLLFNPLWLLVVLVPRRVRLVAGMVLAGGVLALVLPYAPPHQYVADVTAAFLPVNVVAAWVLMRSERRRLWRSERR